LSSSYPNIGSLPLGVAILAILIGLFGAFFLIVGILYLLTVLIVTSAFVFGIGEVGAILLVIFGLVLLAVAAGLWNQELWALALSLIVLILLLVADIINGRLVTIESLIIVLLIIYLIAVREHFD
jgi:hypothetical protein